MKRKLLALFVAVLTLASMTLPAFADLIWEPRNDFYASHMDECEYVNRMYLANGEKGYITLASAPDSLVEVINVPNGTALKVGHVWTDNSGREWGACPLWQDEKLYEGWVALDQMALLYDNVAFEEDHSAEFTEYDGSGDHLEKACLYSWPGGVYQSTLQFDREHNPPSEALRRLYTDENGLRWSFISYYYGRRQVWLCIDDPMNEKLGVETALTVAQMRGESQTLIDPTRPPEEQPSDQPLQQPSDQSAQQPQPAPSETIYPPAQEVPPARTWVVYAIPAALIVIVAVVTALIVRKRKK